MRELEDKLHLARGSSSWYTFRMNILVIDGQGGKLGKQLCEEIKKRVSNATITAVGTNSIATLAMQKGGADVVATGENPVLVALRKADVVMGPIGIVVADALLGEITPKMAQAIGSAGMPKILLPIGKCNNIVAGVKNASYDELISDAIDKLIGL